MDSSFRLHKERQHPAKVTEGRGSADGLRAHHRPPLPTLTNNRSASKEQERSKALQLLPVPVPLCVQTRGERDTSQLQERDTNSATENRASNSLGRSRNWGCVTGPVSEAQHLTPGQQWARQRCSCSSVFLELGVPAAPAALPPVLTHLHFSDIPQAVQEQDLCLGTGLGISVAEIYSQIQC